MVGRTALTDKTGPAPFVGLPHSRLRKLSKSLKPHVLSSGLASSLYPLAK